MLGIVKKERNHFDGNREHECILRTKVIEPTVSRRLFWEPRAHRATVGPAEAPYHPVSENSSRWPFAALRWGGWKMLTFIRCGLGTVIMPRKALSNPR